MKLILSSEKVAQKYQSDRQLLKFCKGEIDI